MRRHAEGARQKGYALDVPGVTVVGMAVPARYQRPYMAPSVSAISSRIPPERIPKLASLPKHSAAKIAG